MANFGQNQSGMPCPCCRDRANVRAMAIFIVCRRSRAFCCMLLHGGGSPVATWKEMRPWGRQGRD
eukprot:2718073-Pyramimonas_sp.AAC.1